MEEEDVQGSPGLTVVNRHIYFYCAVMPETVQELAAHMKSLEMDGLVHATVHETEPLPIHLHIMSPGGDMQAGFAAANMIRTCRVPVITYAEGRCLSAATLMSCSGHSRRIGQSAMILIHQLAATIEGKHDDFKDFVNNNEKLMAQAVSIYARVVPPEKMEFVTDLLRREVMLTASESVDLGLADEIF